MDWKSSCRTCISSWWACNWNYHHLLSTQLQRNDSLCDQLLLLSLGPELVHNSCKSCTFSHILVALILSYLSSPPSSLLPFLSAHKIWNFEFHYFENIALSGRNKVKHDVNIYIYIIRTGAASTSLDIALPSATNLTCVKLEIKRKSKETMRCLFLWQQTQYWELPIFFLWELSWECVQIKARQLWGRG